MKGKRKKKQTAKERREKKSGASICKAGRKSLSRTKREGEREKREKGERSIMKNNQKESEEPPIIAKKIRKKTKRKLSNTR